MFKDFFNKRLFVGGLAFFILCVGVSLLYMQHVEQEIARESAEHEKRIRQWDKEQNATAKVQDGGDTQIQKIDEKSTGTPTTALDGHWHDDGTWHATSENGSFPTEKASTEKLSETEVSAESSNQRGPDFVFNSPILYSHELKQWAFDLNDRLNRNHPELVRISQMTRDEILATYSREELEVLNKEAEQLKDQLIAEVRALVQALPKDMRDQTVLSTYDETLEQWGPEIADQFLENLFQ